MLLILMSVEIRLQEIYNTFTAAYADDLTAVEPIEQLKKWWDELCRLVPKFGYYPEGSKSSLVIRKNAEERAKRVFKQANIRITTEGKRHIGEVIGTTNYQQNYIKEKIDKWITELRMLCNVAWYEPQAAYSYFITGLQHKPTYFMQTISNISKQLKQLDEIVRFKFMPAMSGGINR